jgi:hypothetical protein
VGVGLRVIRRLRLYLRNGIEGVKEVVGDVAVF